MPTTNHQISVRKIYFLACMFCIVASVFTQAQTQSYTKGISDSNLRGNLEVDPSTLGMSFNLPMGGYGGRGATLPIGLTYSSKVWRMQLNSGFTGYSYYIDQIEAKYADQSTAGWTSSTGVPYIEYTGPDQAYDDQGQPLCLNCQNLPPAAPFFVPRILLHLPDGSSHELRREHTYYNADSPQLFLNSGVYSGVFKSLDGSRITYDFGNSTITLPDGSRYWLAAPNGVQYIDRNGNTLTFNTSNNQWTDTLGRVINAIPLNNGTVGDLDYLMPGVGGVNQKYTLRWKKLGDAGVLTVAEPLRFKGTVRWWTYNPTIGISPSLFGNVGDLHERICDNGFAGTEFNPVVLNEIVLPNGLSYKFMYNIYGEINKVVMPTGGYEKFEHGAVANLSGLQPPYDQGNRGVIHHWISATGNAADEAQWNYSSTGGSTSVTNPSGSRAERTLFYNNTTGSYYGFEDVRDGKASEERTYNASNQMIRRTLVNWVAEFISGSVGGLSTATRNPLPTKKVEVILDTTGNALAAVTIPTYDADLNEIKSDHYDYTSVSQSTGQTGAISAFSAGTLLRTEETTYLVNDTSYSQAIRDAYRARNMLGMPSKKLVKNGAGVVVAAMEYKYDEAAYPLLTYASVTGYVDPATTYRGNVTTMRSWNNNGNQVWANWTSGTWIETHTQYDQCGSPRNAWDGKGNLAQVEYTDAFSDAVNRNTYAYPTKTTSPVPDPGGTYGANTTLIVQTKYDFASGKVTWVQDANNQVATTEYEPVLGSGYNSLNRLKRVVRPTGGGETTYEYGDTVGNMWVKTRTLRAASTWLESVTYLDKIGRAWLSATSEGSNSWLVSETKYDNQGRAYQGSNPYRVTAATADVVPTAAAGASGKVWTTSTFDALNRVLTVTTPDNAVVTTNYSGNQVTVTDQAGKQRKSETDALGRLVKVWEAPSNENYLTTYTYNTLGDLTNVNQSGQTRTFVYDSLKRLLSATNPESGTTTYTYDNNSNLLTKTDARPLTTTFAYDNLNRNTTVGYSAYTNGTSFVERHYDNATLGKGKFHYNVKYNTESNGTPVYNYDQINSYDAVGRPTSKSQNFLVNQGGYTWKPYTTSVTYDLASNVTSQTYPSGRTVNYAYDAAGRTTDFTGNLGGTQRNYSTAMKYDAAGHLTKETFGTTTPLYQNFHYNIRQQLYDVRVGTNINDDLTWNRGALEFLYGSAGWGGSNPDNNGNITRSDHWIPDVNGAWNATTYDYYGYDGLNRITSTSEYTNSSSNTNVVFNYTQAFTIDQWGNRTIHQTNTTTLPDINKKDFAVNTANNRLGVPVGQFATMSYDNVGNLINDTYTNPAAGGAMDYDADNHMTSVVNGSHKYRYNADGKRVRRIIASQGEFWMVYGIGGELVAEYNASTGIPAPTSPSKEYGYRNGQMLVIAESSTVVKWLVQDHLGSTRMEIGLIGNLSDVTRHDYLPFGEELAGAMRVGNGYGGATNTKQKFTGYERDSETGLDFAQARYMSSVQGRFTSVDPNGVGAAIIEPQSWNGYAYVGNRPTTLTDPSGLLWIRAGDSIKWYTGTREDFEKEYGANSDWKIVTEFIYNSVSNGWVKLNRDHNDFTAGFKSREEAGDSGISSLSEFGYLISDAMLATIDGIGQIPAGLGKDINDFQNNPDTFWANTNYSLNGILPTLPSLSLVSASAAAEVDLVGRVNTLSNAITQIERERFVTTAVLSAESTSGATQIIVASSRIALPSAQKAALLSQEIGAVGVGHAEVTALNVAKAMGLRPVALAVSKPICTGCAPIVIQSGVKALTPFK